MPKKQKSSDPLYIPVDWFLPRDEAAFFRRARVVRSADLSLVEVAWENTLQAKGRKENQRR